MNKSRAQRSHAKRRAFQRYGLALNRKDMQRVIDDIQNGRATLLKRQSNRVTIWMVMVEGKECRVVYDKQRKNLVSFLPIPQPTETLSHENDSHQSQSAQGPCSGSDSEGRGDARQEEQALSRCSQELET